MTNRLAELEEDYGKEMVLKVIQMFIPDAGARIAQIDRKIFGRLNRLRMD